MSDIRAILAASPLFRSTDLEGLAPELDRATEIPCLAGEVLLDPLHPNERIFVVLSGQLLVTPDPELCNSIATLKTGDCIGELSIIDNRPPSAYVVATTDCRLLAISQELLWEMQEKQQTISFNLLKILAERIREKNETLLNSLELQRQYRIKAETDALTGLKNRSWLEEIFPRQLDLSERIGQRITLVMIDIDHFKAVNDTYGHKIGDHALSHIGSLIRQNSRNTDLAARYGGEEMVIMMPATDAVQALRLAERLRKTVAANPVRIGADIELNLTISAGIAEWYPGITLETLFLAADQALYRAKNSGRNRVVSSALTNPLGLQPRVENGEV